MTLTIRAVKKARDLRDGGWTYSALERQPSPSAALMLGKVAVIYGSFEARTLLWGARMPREAESGSPKPEHSEIFNQSGRKSMIYGPARRQK